jgi:hypothetical protein
MNSAYKHLDAKLRIASLSVTEWCGVITGVALAIAWGAYIHPLSGMPNTVIAVYIGGVPAVLAWMSAQAEINLLMRARALVRWRRGEDRYLPGAAMDAPGYTVCARDSESRSVALQIASESPSLEALWQ